MRSAAPLRGGLTALRLGKAQRWAQVLESTRAVDTIVLDKTGTITTGQMRDVTVPGVSPDEVLALAGALGHASEHLARAIATTPHPI